ncbi:MAG: hypothetical protein ABJB69_05070 [Spartobacteria bacterium]
MNMQTQKKFVLLVVAIASLALSQASQAGPSSYSSDGKSVPIEQAVPPVDWREFAISPVSNPIFFEDPRIETGARLIFLYNRVGDDFGLHFDNGARLNLGGADIFAYGAQLRWAVTPRLAIIATNNVGISFRPDNPIPGTAFTDADGYSDLDVGLKYALIDDPVHQFLLTPILTYAIPTGGRDVFQGDNSGIFDLAFSTEKGFDKFHLIGNAGVRIPVDGDRNSTSLHYSLHADYFVCRYFIPLVEFNGWTVLDSPPGNKGPLGALGTALNTEGADLINFGTRGNALDTDTQAAFGVGFRSKLCKYVDFGVIYEHAVTSPQGAFEQRVTTDLIIHF